MPHYSTSIWVPALALVAVIFHAPPGKAEDDALKNIENEVQWHHGAFDREREAIALRKGIALIESKEGRDSLTLVPWLIKLGTALHAPGDYPEAERALRRALAIVENAKGPEDRLILDILPALARRLSDQGTPQSWRAKHAEIQSLWKRAIAIAEKVHGPESGEVQVLYIALGHAYRYVKNFAPAEAAYQRALEIHNKRSKRLDPYLNMWLAELRADQGRYAEAEPLVLAAIRHYDTDQWAREGPGRTVALRQLWAVKGAIENGLGRLDDAVKSYEEALRLAENGQPESLYEAIRDAGDIYRKAKRPAEAEKQYRRALIFAERLAGTEGIDASMVLQRLGKTLADTRRWPEAVEAFSRSLRIREKIYGFNDADLEPLLQELGQTYRGSGRDAEAKKVAARIRSLKPSHR